jgi:serine/threonine protein kinase/tetratricopeptide (TPR) repeat protein
MGPGEVVAVSAIVAADVSRYDMTLAPENWPRLKEVFDGARGLGADARPAYLAAACGSDTSLRHEVEALLESHDRAQTFLETPAPGLHDGTAFVRAQPIGSNTPLEPDRLFTVGPYRITSKLGEGGMGVVYAAHDERLHRHVALKMISKAAADDRARDRLWREARAAASLNHPNVCQLYEVGEEKGELFLVMELLEGESLAARLLRGPLRCADAVQVALAILAALEALHRRGLVHRDLKPSNIFLTSHGVKLLDFGLARPIPPGGGATATDITLEGMVTGTPAYMAPEQVLGQTVDARADLFAAGSLLFEMLCGHPPFTGDSIVRVLHAITAEQPPALGGSPAIVAVDRVIHRALSKNRDDRYQTADAMAQDLRATLLVADSGITPTARPMTRLIVLPFRILRSDPETDFLAFSLPDAITGSLSGLDSMIVRSSIVASRFGGEAQDVRTIADEADVDTVLTGTLLRAGDELRVTTQLVEAPDGTLVWSQTSQLPLGDLFRLQDDLASRIVESLSLPLTTREQRLLKHDVPASAKAYEFYLRANQLATNYSKASLARDLYLECLQEDPRYAPAWARLGRVHRILAKFFDTNPEEGLHRAESAFIRALEINPDLSVAHDLYAHLEVDLGRAQHAMTRLLERAQSRTNDPELFAGLVHACRYCGLLDASLAADERARRLDKQIRTSVVQTHFHLGNYQRVHDMCADEPAAYLDGLALVMLGREQEAVVTLRKAEQVGARKFNESLRMLLEGHRAEGLAAMRTLLSGFRDPEGPYVIARQFAHYGDSATALALLARAVEEGYFAFSTMARDPWLDTLRDDPTFREILRHAEVRHREALAAFLQVGGDRLLGLRVS